MYVPPAQGATFLPSSIWLGMMCVFKGIHMLVFNICVCFIMAIVVVLFFGFCCCCCMRLCFFVSLHFVLLALKVE